MAQDAGAWANDSYIDTPQFSVLPMRVCRGRDRCSKLDIQADNGASIYKLRKAYIYRLSVSFNLIKDTYANDSYAMQRPF